MIEKKRNGYPPLVEQFDDLSVDAIHTLNEGSGIAVVATPKKQ
jgi:hypothetical protein